MIDLFGRKAKKQLQDLKFKNYLFLDGLAVTATIWKDRSETYPSLIYSANAAKFIMEKFAEEYHLGAQLDNIYKQYPDLEQISITLGK